MQTFVVGDITVRRISFIPDVTLSGPALSMTVEEIHDCQEWGAWCSSPDGHGLRIGITVTVIDAGDERIVVDPMGAADDFFRSRASAVDTQKAAAVLLKSHEIPIESVTTVVMAHLDGIGLVAAYNVDNNSWSPFFPNARILMHPIEIAFLRGQDIDDVEQAPQGLGAFRQLLDTGHITPLTAPGAIAHGVTVEHTGGHSEGHCIVRIAADKPDDAGTTPDLVMVGHLIVQPLNISLGAREGLDFFPADAQHWRDALCTESSTLGTVLYGPLWPSPGAATAKPTAGGGWQLSPVSDSEVTSVASVSR